MVSRLEGVLIVAILFFSGKGILTDLSRDTQQSKVSKEKELELSALTFIEVNQTTLLHTITASHMTKYADKTRYEDFALYTPDFTLLSPHAVAQQRSILLDQNATVLKKDGSRYYAGAVIYDSKNRRLNLTDTFSLANRFGDINGTQMRYDAKRQEIHGESVKASYDLE